MKRAATLVSFLVLANLRPASPQGVGPEAGGRDRPVLSYQVGAFFEKTNADRLVAELFSRGYYGTAAEKVVAGKTLWCVTVEAPANPFEDFRAELLSAGYPSFPMR